MAVAGFALIASSFILTMTAHAQSAAAACAIAGNVARHLTTGSTGADVTALQNWLISKGYSIPAGATGYFGTQTRAAVAAYQAANGIVPAAGYFGPITRAKVAAQCVVVVPPADDQDDEDEDEDNDDDKQNEADESEDALEDARDSLDNARDEVEEANDDGEDTDDAEEDLDEAEELLDEADEAFDDGDYDEVMDLIEEAEDLIDEALDDVDADDEEVDGDDNVETSAEVNDRSGADNDIATFEIEFILNAFNQDAYIDEDTSVSINYEIQDSSGDDVGGATSLSAVLQSSANQDDGYFVVEEGEEETFTLTVSFDPLAADEGAHYRLQLESVEFNDTDAAPDQTWTASPENRFRTDYVYIAD